MSFFLFLIGIQVNDRSEPRYKIFPELKIIVAHKCRNGIILSLHETLKIPIKAGTRRKKRLEANNAENSQRGFEWDDKHYSLKLNCTCGSHFIDLRSPAYDRDDCVYSSDK